MEWALIGIMVLGVLLVAGWKAKRSDDRQNERFSTEMQANTPRFQALSLRDAMPVLDPVMLNYRPVSGEVIHAVRTGVKDNRNGAEGRLLVTNKAIVFETPSRTDRFPLPSNTDIQIALDGFSIRKRTGPVRPFLTGTNPEFLAAVNVISWRLN